MKAIVKLLPLIFILSILTGTFYSCRKTGPADAVVTIVDTLNRPVQGAKVVLRQDSVVNTHTGVQADVYQEQISDFNGQAVFSFQLEAVLIVEVTKGALYEDDYIRLEQSKQVEKTVILK